MRTFIAIEVPENIRRMIVKHTGSFRAGSLPIKWVACENLHVTMKFLGEITEAKQREVEPLLQHIGSGHQPFTITLMNFGCFPNPRKPRVIWLGIDQGTDDLCAVARELEDKLCKCGFVKEKRFHPHLTLGRIKKPCSIEHIVAQEFYSDHFQVDSLVLFKSILTAQGAVYKVLTRFKFQDQIDNKH